MSIRTAFGKEGSRSSVGLETVWADSDPTQPSWRSFIWHACYDGFVGVLRSPLTSGLTIITIGLALFVLSLFFGIVSNVEAFLERFHRDLPVNVFMQDGAKERDLRQFRSELEARPGVARVEFIDKEQGLLDLREALGNRPLLLGGIDTDNPLPNLFEVYLSESDESAELRENLQGELSEHPLVEEVAYSSLTLLYIQEMLDAVRLVGGGAVLLMLLVASFIIVTTVRLAMYSQRLELQIMKLVGATDTYVSAPYVVRGLLEGLFGAVLAGVGTFAAAYGLNQGLHSLPWFGVVQQQFFSVSAWGIVVVLLAGLGTGMIASYLAARSFVKATHVS